MRGDSFAEAIIDAVLETAKFVGYDPINAKAIAATLLSLAASAAFFMMMLCMRTHDRAVDHKYGLDADPDEDLLCVIEYSPDGALEIRTGGCRIVRSGAGVSNLIRGILSITCNVDAKDRVISIIYEDPDPGFEYNKTKTEKIRCGEMSDEAYTIIRRHMLQQAGG